MFNKNKIALVAAVGVMAGFSGAANAAQGTASATATILSPITVTKTADLAFGKIIAGASSGTVTISAAGSLTCAAALTCSGTTAAAAFDVSGSSSEIVTITPDSSVTLTSGANSMSASLNASAATLTLNGSGAGSFTVGGVLTVGASQAAGSYSGNFNVTVNYQ
ncbi:DUF4402 domain-containing protein [Sphingobium sp. DEHP117]|uniref:DUF4402 domain-containing protein n=1 Tax=Sphingobium sp. DEHP117 TaxID=2993436 RepID=UPI0027D5848E|nr:DUF4402 domain-containing protein [Sphingobium sp. DEHP117]MDQ4418995.1 DUF4402 domain-containing protein [Sphingobium sp. DEHP117]